MGKVEIRNVGQPKRRILTAVIALVAAFLFANIAIDRGLIWYFPFFISLFIGARALVQLIKKK